MHTAAGERLKLMSYNIRNGIGIDNIQDIGRIARVILREAPDLVALQELDSATLRVDGRYIPGELGRMTGMHATFGRAIGFAGGSYGVGVMTRERILDHFTVALPRGEGAEPRVLTVVELARYVIATTHLDHVSTLAQAGQVDEINKVIEREFGGSKKPVFLREATDTCRKPVLLAGDFNTGNAAAVLAGLGGGFRILSDTTRMTFPSDNPAVRIDYILGRGLPTSATVAESAVDHTATASDHCPLWVTLVWKRGKQPGK